jgi:hypothetical protein
MNILSVAERAAGALLGWRFSGLVQVRIGCIGKWLADPIDLLVRRISASA